MLFSCVGSRMRNQEFPLLALLLSLVLFISIPCLARNHKQLCPPSSCGSLRDIHYPFRLKGDPVGCGDPDFELSCVGNQTILLLQNMEFYVKEINYTTGDLRIIFNQNDMCLFPRNHLTTAKLRGDERFCLDEYVSIINFVICSQVISDSGYSFIPCANTSKEKAYITEYTHVSSLESSCRHVASLPVTNDSSYFYSLETVVPRVLANGFNYRWSEKRQGCKTRLSDCVFQCLKNATRYHLHFPYYTYPRIKIFG
ncbi:hypothetical protein QJS10_CPB14g00203 [Acorus calamus]|uniref:RING-type E3 ubiquitin transferase n=1 Tax=Acorus calamus TaxID=4465 RepID=A0AAV9DEZ3_ACOCL|nr:hypothetical protein QJS10_CPB14g00203 [Acorus calamus]